MNLKRMALYGGVALTAVAATLVVLHEPEQTRSLVTKKTLPHTVLKPVQNATTESKEAVEDLDEMETVLGMSVLKDRDCTLYEMRVQDESGETSVAYRCEPNNPKEIHPYGEYSIELLRELAYRDADAAEILGIKLIQRGDESEGLQFVYRSVALGGGKSASALKRAHNTFYSSIVDAEAPNYEPKPAFAAMEKAYVFARIRDELNGVNYSEWIRAKLETHGFTEFDRLDREARDALEVMADVEIEVVGSNTIQEKIDADA